MRKKYLSALLFGALLFASAGTFTSCKDYDDDINNLQEQIDAQKSLSEKLTAVESSIAELQKADSDLQTKINAVEEAAEKAALEAQQNAVKEATAQLETVKTELTALINEQTEATNASIESINTEIAKIQGSVQALEKLNGDIEALRTVDANLQASISEIEKTVAENARKIGELQTTLEAQEDALELFKAATGENIGALQGDITELQGKIAELAGSDDLRLVSEQLAALQDDFETLSSKVDTISTNLNLLKNAWYTGVTSVSLVQYDIYNNQVELLSAKSLTTRTFGEGLKGAVKFTKGTRTKLKDAVLVRVSPVTADLAAESIKFINSKGEESLNNLVTVTAIKPYENLMTRSTSASGLWIVELEAKDDIIDEEFETAFDNATRVSGFTEDDEDGYLDESSTELKQILFAMKVVDRNNDNPRGVVSEYDLTFGKEDLKAADDIDFDIFVGSGFTNKINVSNLHNRYGHSEEDGTETPKEYSWGKDGAQPEAYYVGALTNTVDNKDDRWGEGLNSAEDYVINPVVEAKKESFKLRIKNENEAEGKTGITHYYITLDKNYAVTSDDSERLTWEQLYESHITGINQVYSIKENPIVTIGFDKAINDVLGFRVYAINANGTLADPDGKAFYVRVGEVANTASASTTLVADANIVKKPSAYVAFDNVAQFASNETIIADNSIEYGKVYNKSNNEIDEPFNIRFVMKDDSEVKVDDFTGQKLSTLADIKQVYVYKNTDWTNYIDDQAYTNVISFKDNKGVVIATLNVTVTKTLPVTLPEGFGWKNQQTTDTQFNCYLIPDKFGFTNGNSNAQEASLASSNMFNSGKGKTDKYTFVFSTDDPSTAVKVDGIADDKKFTLTKDKFNMIDDETSYKVTISYNYGVISSKNQNEVIISDETYTAKYMNIYGSTYSITLNSKADTSVKYGQGNGSLVQFKLDKSAVNIDKLFDCKSSYDGIYNATLADIADQSEKGGFTLLEDECKVITNSNGQISEYFKLVINDNHPAGIEALHWDSNIVNTVESTVVLVYKDNYGNKRIVNVPFKITKR